jgi:transcriptional regulator with XRE-family HTH domain
MSSLDRDTADARLAENVRRLREQAGMSQAALAGHMREHGHNWHQQTVGRAESGSQQVRYSEAVALAGILHASLNQLTWSPPEVTAEYLLNQSIAQAYRAYKDIRDRTRGMLATQDHLRRRLGDVEKAAFRDSPNLKGTIAEAAEVLGLTPDAALEDGYAAFEAGEEEGDG